MDNLFPTYIECLREDERIKDEVWLACGPTGGHCSVLEPVGGQVVSSKRLENLRFAPLSGSLNDKSLASNCIGAE